MIFLAGDWRGLDQFAELASETAKGRERAYRMDRCDFPAERCHLMVEIGGESIEFQETRELDGPVYRAENGAQSLVWSPGRSLRLETTVVVDGQSIEHAVTGSENGGGFQCQEEWLSLSS